MYSGHICINYHNEHKPYINRVFNQANEECDSCLGKKQLKLSDVTTRDNRPANLHFGISKRGTRKVRKKSTNIVHAKKKRK